jgi:AraC-like DNA-binding protein
LEVTPLVRELVLAVSELPADYPLDGPESRLVAVLLDQLEHLPEAGFTLTFPQEPRLVRICAALREHPDDPRTLEELAAWVGMSGRTLARLFARETGLGFREWRLNLRLLLSLSALQQGRGVTAVALDVGYDSPSAFIAAFKRHFGRTPGEFFSR